LKQGSRNVTVRVVVLFKLFVQEKGQQPFLMAFDREEITVGRLNRNDIVLKKADISKKHVKILYKDGKLVLADLRSTNGTFVNGSRINAPCVLKQGDSITLGEFIIRIAEVRG
jgi:pilus assembly protein CpaF